jgi:hypothetical protein
LFKNNKEGVDYSRKGNSIEKNKKDVQLKYAPFGAFYFSK